MIDYYKELDLQKNKPSNEITADLIQKKTYWKKYELVSPEVADEKLSLIEEALNVFSSEDNRKKYESDLVSEKMIVKSDTDVNNIESVNGGLQILNNEGKENVIINEEEERRKRELEEEQKKERDRLAAIKRDKSVKFRKKLYDWLFFLSFFVFFLYSGHLIYEEVTKGSISFMQLILYFIIITFVNFINVGGGVIVTTVGFAIATGIYMIPQANMLLRGGEGIDEVTRFIAKTVGFDSWFVIKAIGIGTVISLLDALVMYLIGKKCSFLNGNM